MLLLLKTLAASLLILLLILIAILHFYWAAGGKLLSDGVFPELESRKSLQPITIPIIPTIIVGFGLLAMAGIVVVNMEWISAGDWRVWTRYGLWAITVIFLLRAIGDFKYVGFFKRQKNSLFAEKDTKYYSPLSLGMSLFGFIVLFC